MNPNRDDHSDDIEAWLRELQTAPTPEKAASGDEAVLLRQAILKLHAEQDSELMQGTLSDEHAWQRMQFRLRKEGLFQRSRAPLYWASALAASVLVGVVLVRQQSPDETIVAINSAPAAIRGSAAVARVDDPLGRATALAKQLKAVDPGLQVYWHDATATLDFAVTADQVVSAEALIKPLPFDPPVELTVGRNRLQLKQTSK